jgi:DNA modification methylase
MAIDWKIYNGDCLEVMKTLADSSIDFVLSDLPYGQTDADWDKPIDLQAMWAELKRIVKKDAAICLFASQPFTSLLVASHLPAFKHEWIWFKNRTSNFLNAKVQPLKAHESILVFSHGKCPYYPQKSQGHTPINFARRKANSSELYGSHNEAINSAGNTDRYPTSVLLFNSVDNCAADRSHSNQKPIDLLQYLIRTYTSRGQKVLDLTAGSFAHCVAAVVEKRIAVGIEISEEKCVRGEVWLKRVSNEPCDIPQRITDKELPLFGV